MEQPFDSEQYAKGLRECHEKGVGVWNADEAAQLMTIFFVFGTEGEGFTQSPKFVEDFKFIQETYKINHKTEWPVFEILQPLNKWIRIYKEAARDKRKKAYKDAERWIRDMYGYKHFNQKI